MSERCAVICTGEPHLHNGAGLTGLEGFFGLLRRSAIFVGGDSGGAHAAGPAASVKLNQVGYLPAAQKLAVEEFSALVAQSAGSALGGLGYAQRTLEIAKGDYKASAIVGRIGEGVAGADEFKAHRHHLGFDAFRIGALQAFCDAETRAGGRGVVRDEKHGARFHRAVNRTVDQSHVVRLGKGRQAP